MTTSEKTTTVGGAEVIAQSLEKNGVTHVFNLPGHGMGPLVSALDAHRDKLRYVSGVNETVVATIAEGYSRATRTPAFVNVYHSSGTMLALFALSVAWADHTPMVLSTTADPVALASHDGYAAVPKAITQVTEQYTKWSYEVPSVDKIPWAIERALMIASTPPMGPVHLSFPMSLYADQVDESTLHSRYARAKLFDQVSADEAGIERAATLLAGARSPLILAGGPIGQYGAIEELVALAELLDAPVLRELGRPTYLPFPTRHRLFAGKYGHDHELVKNADVILVAEFDVTESVPRESPFWDSDQSMIHLTVDHSAVCKQFDPDVILLGHPKPSLQMLAKRVAAASGGVTREGRDFSYERTDGVVSDGSGGPRPRRGALVDQLVGVLRQEFGQKLTIADHALTAPPSARGAVPLSLEASDYSSKDDYFALSQKGSAQGWLLPAAVGIQLGLPERQVVAALGDGNFMFTAGALYSAAKMQIPLIVVVVNNGGYGGGRMGGSHLAPETNQGNFREPPIDFCKIAEGSCVPAYKIATAEDIGPAVDSLHQRGRPFLFEVIE